MISVKQIQPNDTASTGGKFPTFFVIIFVIFIILVMTSVMLALVVNLEKNEYDYRNNISNIANTANTAMSRRYQKQGGSAYTKSTNSLLKSENQYSSTEHNSTERSSINYSSTDYSSTDYSAEKPLIIDEKIAQKYNLTPLDAQSYAAEKQPKWGISYIGPATNKQIQTLLKSNKKDMFAVLELLAKHIKTDTKGFIKLMINKGWSMLDSDIYAIILKALPKASLLKMERSSLQAAKSPDLKSSDLESKNTTRDNLHAKLYAGYLRKYTQLTPTVYLDFGCGDCNKTELMGKLLGLDPKNVHGADVTAVKSKDTTSGVNNTALDTSFLHYDVGRNPNVNFTLIKDAKLAYPDNTFDLISAFMVLHHVKEIRPACAELSRVMRAGGILIVREHDAYNAADYMLCDIEHAIYDLGYPGVGAASRNPDFAANYYAKYRSWLEWAELLGEFGFEFVAMEYDNFSIRKDIGPTRYVCLVFCKK